MFHKFANDAYGHSIVPIDAHRSWSLSDIEKISVKSFWEELQLANRKGLSFVLRELY